MCVGVAFATGASSRTDLAAFPREGASMFSITILFLAFAAHLCVLYMRLCLDNTFLQSGHSFSVSDPLFRLTRPPLLLGAGVESSALCSGSTCFAARRSFAPRTCFGESCFISDSSCFCSLRVSSVF